MKSKTPSSLKIPALSFTPKILIVIAPYYSEVTDMLLSGAKTVFDTEKIKFDTVLVPGALEIPTAINLTSNHFDGFVALGCIIRGETSHYEIVSNESSNALTLLGLQKLCIGNGILAVENYSQAITRADPKEQNKGGYAAEAVLHLIAIKSKFKAYFKKSLNHEI